MSWLELLKLDGLSTKKYKDVDIEAIKYVACVHNLQYSSDWMSQVRKNSQRDSYVEQLEVGDIGDQLGTGVITRG